MPRVNLIILDQPQSSIGTGRLPYRVAMWADVPSDRQVFYAALNQHAVSQWMGATSTDNTAIQSGAMVEQVIVYNPDIGQTITAIGVTLTTMSSQYQAAVNAYNPWGYYGTTYVSTATPAWTVTTVA